MEAELKNYRQGELPYTQINKELAAQYPNIIALTLTKGKRVTGTTSDDKYIAIVESRSAIAVPDIEKIRKWLAIRLDISDIQIITQVNSAATAAETE